MKKFCLIAVLVVLAPFVRAQGSSPAPKPSPATEWYRAGHVTLRLADSANDFNASWQFDRADNGDNRVIREERRGGKLSNGTVMTVCDDFALLMQGVIPEKRHEMIEMDEPVLHLQLLLRLLARAVPEGPAVFGNDKLVEISEPVATIRVRKGMEARRDFNAPWQARGRITRAPGGDVAFELVFFHAAGGAVTRQRELTMAGVWRQETRAHSFADSMAIEDWRVFRVDQVPVTAGGTVHIEQMATTTPLQYATLGHLRRHIERSWSPNPKVAPIMQCKP